MLHFREQLLEYIRKLKGGLNVTDKLRSSIFTISQCLVLVKSSVKYIDEAEDVEIFFIEQFFKIGQPVAKIEAYNLLAILTQAFEVWWSELGFATIQNREDSRHRQQGPEASILDQQGLSHPKGKKP